MHSLEQKRFETTKEKVHVELVNYFVNLDEQHKLWYFTVAVNSNAKSHHFTQPQAEKLIDDLSKNYDIRRSNIELAVAFNPCCSLDLNKKQKVIMFNKIGLLSDIFEEQLSELYRLIKGKLLEYRQALELTLVLLDNYPAARRLIN
jgi:hypothetical protein